MLYGTEVNLERAVPDIYDGLKPVQRRVLWGAYHQPRGVFVKSARIVGDVIGKYHPHSDVGTYGAMVTMQQSPEPYVLGKGNWGTLVDPPAAHRYTNATLTEYGYSFFDKDYINKEVTDYVPNYDDKDIEPVTLPAQLPNVLINGATGIGWGITTNTPSFTRESVISALLSMLKGKKVSVKELAKTLKPKFKYGGRLVDSPANKENWLKLMSNNSAKIDYEAELTIDEAKKSIIVDNWPPGLHPVKFIDKVRALQGTKSAYNSKGTLTFTIECDRKYNLNQFKEYVNKVQKLTRTSETYKINVTRRTAKVDDGVVSYDNEFLSLSVGKLLVEWLKMRIALEKRSLEFRIRKLKERIAYSELLLYATSIRQVIFKSLEQKDSAAYMVKHSKLDLDQAKQILELKVRQLSRLDSLQIKEQMKQQKQELKQLQRWLKKPRNKVYEDLEKLSKKTK